MKKPRVLMADDHVLVMEGLKSLLAGHVDLIGTAENGRELVEAAIRLQPEIILLDISMPVLHGIEAARQLRKSVPRAKLIFVTQYADPLYVDEALQLGASGYVLKRCAVSELVTAIQAVSRGQRYITPLMRPTSADEPPPRGRLPVSGELTPRERELLQLVAEGWSAKEIAYELSISVKTVQFHKSNLTRKLGLHTTAELVKFAVRRGMTAP